MLAFDYSETTPNPSSCEIENKVRKKFRLISVRVTLESESVRMVAVSCLN